MRGFTLIETIVYLALFSILFTGVLVSSYTFFRGAENVSARVVKENEIAFVVRKMATLLASASAVTSPSSGTSGSTLTFSTYSGDSYTFTIASDAATLQKNSTTPVVLTAERVKFTNFSVSHTAATGGFPRYIEYSFTVEGETFGPIRKYFTF